MIIILFYKNWGKNMKIGASMLATEDRTMEEALEYFETINTLIMLK